MRNLRFALLIAALVMSLAAFAQEPAQGQGPRGGHAGMGRGGRQMPSVDDQVARLTKALNLSDDQQTKVRGILQDSHEQMAKTFQDQNMSREDRHSKMMEMRESTHNKIRDLLNDDQKKKFEDFEKQRGQMRGHGGRDNNSGPEDH